MRASYPVQLALFTLVHWLAAVLGLQWAMVEGAGSPVWPAAGVALAGLLLGGIRMWPGVLVGRFGAALAVGSAQPLWTDLLIAAGNTASVVLAVLLIRSAGAIDLRLARLRDVLWIAGAAAAAAIIAASAGTTSLWLSRGFGAGEALMVWSNWLFGNFVGAMTITPAILGWATYKRFHLAKTEGAHLAAIWGSLSAVCWLMFLGETEIRSWLLFPFLVWAALAFHVRGVAVALVIVSGFAIWGATMGSGPLVAIISEASPILMTQQFVAVVSLTMLILAATAEERQRRLESELSETSRNLEAVLNNTSMAVFLMDERQACSYMNSAAEELTGYRFEEIEGRNLHDAVHHAKPDGTPYPSDECPIGHALPRNEKASGEEVFVHKDGRFYPVAYAASPIRDERSQTVGTVLEVRDISEEKAREAVLRDSEARLQRLNAELEERVEQRTEELRRQIAEREEVQSQLQHSRKLDAIGQLTGGIAHDFNNLLTAVVGGLDVIERTTEEPRTRRLAGNGLKAAERGVKITAQLLAFSRSQRLEVRPVIVAPIMGEMREMLAHSLGPGIVLELDLDDAGIPVMADPTQLELAILNLAINARDAMPEGGTLRIVTRRRCIEGDPELKRGEYLEVCVSDTGVGMPAEVAARAFEPFFTMKEKGKGTGLGLSMVHGIARQSGGTARIESEPGRGTAVSIFLPRTGEQGAAESADSPEDAPPKGRAPASVLVIDDDPDVRSFLAEALENAGHAVEQAVDGPAGLARLHEERPDLVILDFAMPGMNGAEAARHIRERRPGQPILFISGYSDSAVLEQSAPDAPLLRKPFRADELLRCVDEILNEAPRAG